MKDEGYWSRKIVPKYECSNCGGAVYKTGACPAVKGSRIVFKCIRCGSTGGIRTHLAWDSPRVSGDIEMS